MKITKKELKRIIREEIKKTNEGSHLRNLATSEKVFLNQDEAEQYLVVVNNMVAKDEGNTDLGFIRIYVGRYNGGSSAIVYDDGLVDFFNKLDAFRFAKETLNFKSVVH